MLYEFIGVDLLKDKSWIESSYASMAEAHAEMLIIQYILPSLKIKANKNDEFFGMALQRGLESVLSKVTGYTPFQVGRVEGLFENNTGASFCTDLSSREPLLGVKACKYVFEVRDGTVIDVGCKKNLSSYLQSDDSVVLTVFCKNINKVVRQFFSPDITMTEFKNAQDVCTKNGMSCAYVEWSATAKCIDQLNERECFMESIDLPSFYSACTLSNNRDGAQILESAFKDVQREIVCEK